MATKGGVVDKSEARGDHRWSWVVEEEVLGLGWVFGEKECEKSCFAC